MTLLEYLRADLVKLMKRRDKVALMAVRDAISAIENAETGYLVVPEQRGAGSEHVAGAVAFGHSERVVTALDAARMLDLARGQVELRLAEAANLRAIGRIDRALTLKAEALALSDRLDAFTAGRSGDGFTY